MNELNWHAKEYILAKLKRHLRYNKHEPSKKLTPNR